MGPATRAGRGGDAVGVRNPHLVAVLVGWLMVFSGLWQWSGLPIALIVCGAIVLVFAAVPVPTGKGKGNPR